jgi:CRISP-associated protein Cas1
MLIESVADPLNLYRAWDAVRSSGTSDGVPSKELLRLAGGLDGRLRVVRRELLDGSYRPRPVRRYDIAKGSEGFRHLGIPTIEDRLVERAVMQVLIEELDPLMSPWSFAYRRGVGVDDAVRALAEMRDNGMDAVVRADISDCFGSIDRAKMLDRLREDVDDVRIVDLIERFVERPIQDRGRLVDAACGLHQGSPLSPLLCNLYLDRLDQQLAGTGLVAVRFADDLAVGAPTREAASEVLEQVSEAVRDAGLALADPKTRIATFAEGVAFLGVELGEYLPTAEPPTTQPDRRVLYLAAQGARAALRKGQLRVERGDEVLLSVPVGHVAQVVAVGGVGITAGMRYHAMTEGIEVTFLTRRGRWVGRLDSPRLANVSLRRTQYRRADDETFRLEVSRRIVAGKIANQRALLLRHRRGKESTEAIADAGQQLRRAVKTADNASCLSTLRGIEGAAANTYFKALAMLVPDSVGFTGRNRRPPRDLVNVCLSLGYTLLVGEVVGALAAAGLDPYLGFLHTSAHDRPSLALDLMEEFRPLIVDAAVLHAIRSSELCSEHLHTGDNGRILLTEDGRRRLFRAFETRMLTVFAHVPSGQRTWYRRAILLQARQLAGLIDGRLDTYRPVAWR